MFSVIRSIRFWLALMSTSLLLVDASPLNNQLSGGSPQPRDDALDNYVRLVINNFFAALETGIPALGIPPMDPLWIGNLTVPTLTVQGGHIDAAIANTAVHYLSTLTVTTLHIDLNAFRMDLRSFMPYMKIDGLYDLEGIALVVFPLYGNGPYRIEVFDVNMLGGGSLGLDETGNYLQLTSLEMDATFTTMVVYFENLLGGGDLGDTINDIISELGMAIFELVKPVFIEALTTGIMKVVNDALSHYPIGNLTAAEFDVNWR
ncbi:uncharacterized protein LOC124192739 [Daphnia pulex]|uniref:uncharacterized protein LOC124192739 n=1 Tax=Daphnia pulex TaxID=6669 RepID=UPI001EDDD6D9|nr:uncharacterized protein LOC124192739 [Daphnia pulex]XP_046642230.1 uncharacterized protein LOC124327281 [Daphnia pulicaria]